MIVRMAKVEVVGERSLLEDVLGLVRSMGIFHVDPLLVGFVESSLADDVRAFAPDEKTVMERAFLEDLLLRIEELFSLLPEREVRKSYLAALSVIDVVSKTLPRHVAEVKETSERLDSLRKEKEEIARNADFYDLLAPLLEKAREAPDLEFIGLKVGDPEMETKLRETISRLTNWRFELMTDAAPDGSLVGLIAVEKDVVGDIRNALSHEQVPELPFSPSFAGLSFPEKIAWLKTRAVEIDAAIAKAEASLEDFVHRWVPVYKQVRVWLEDRLSLLAATAYAFETRLCFFLNGWMPAKNVSLLRNRLARSFGGNVTVAEKKILEEDLDRVPITLQNPPYFKPFEIFTRLLPLPVYTSYDPTPFIGIFFPIFFGMILGDAGYGILVGALSLVIMKRYRKHRFVMDGARIAGVASLYTIVFGILYGEFFGELPHTVFGWKPLLVDRRTAVVPMILFSVAVGLGHILLGLVLGAVTALRKKAHREATHRVLNILLVICVVAVIASAAGLAPSLLSRPLIIGILILAPFLLFSGGILAPLEFLKNVGNIISYIRIMAIGYTSVLLAFVANHLAGLTGDVVLGLVVAGLLHLLNIVLGIFSPTIHSLRLHYVEFFGKFIEHGGRRFEPLQKRNDLESEEGGRLHGNEP